MNQKQETINLIEFYIKKVKASDDEGVKSGYINKIIGMLALAKAIDILTTEEYEHYFHKIFS